ncbi:glutamyl-tRNA reductase [Thermodesulfobium acidiphilum]|uniref:Glutamyl-tRNA reductase n=1 Tax=Thermodesulfobium acidiphilum TaxID=1794699 RepID=A0A2R4W0N1_THEAF|nr:glutamyl-tRNA reductase [Thermodesulfobium acidiphilum]AWB10238.1 glutamyl-tRNA reductase [Thermodesulfobium acidiphilum]
MQLRLLGLNYKSATVDIREKISFPGHNDLISGLKILFSIVEPDEAIIISTCNRTEVICVNPKKDIIEFFSYIANIPKESMKKFTYYFEDIQVAKHLFIVASSLDSLVVGESQILSQIKDAQEIASTNKFSSLILNHLISQAIRVGKRVRTETQIGKGNLSVATVAIDLANSIFGSIEKKKILVVGAGKMSKLFLKTLKNHGVSNIFISNRSKEKGIEISSEFNAKFLEFERRFEILNEVDIVLTSTGSCDYIFPFELVKKSTSKRTESLFMIDIAIPRDIDPKINSLENVFLYNIDDLTRIVEKNRSKRLKEIPRVEEIIEEELKIFNHWCYLNKIIPTISRIRIAAEKIRKAEVEKTLSKLNSKLSEKEVEQIDAMTKAIVKKILHNPTVQLKRHINDNNLENIINITELLFNLDSDLLLPDFGKHKELK